MSATLGKISFAGCAAETNEDGIQNGSSIGFEASNTLDLPSGHRLNPDGTSGQFDFFPYFDGEDGGKSAGLGDYRALIGGADIGEPGAPCLIPSDEIIDGRSGPNEGVGFFINKDCGGYNLRGFSFRDSDHKGLNDSNSMLRVNWHVLGATEISSKDMTFAAAVAMAVAGGFGTIDALAFGYIDTSFYVESISDVPFSRVSPIFRYQAHKAEFRLAKKEINVTRNFRFQF